jgi:hypothetical protein
MWRLLFLLSAIPIISALIARWFFGNRVLAKYGQRLCRCNLDKWIPTPNDPTLIHRNEDTAQEYGRQLRLKALTTWKETEPPAAAARENNRRFGMAVPPLTGIVALMAVLIAKIPIIGGISIMLVATAIAALLGILSLPQELAAIAKASKKARASRFFPHTDDFEAISRCAIAHAWKETLPPIFKLLGR